MPVALKAVVSRRQEQEARQVRRALFAAARRAIDEMDDDIAGFAMVVWDREGGLRSNYDTSYGPIRAALVPTLVGDALNRHLAVMLSAEVADEKSR